MVNNAPGIQQPTPQPVQTLFGSDILSQLMEVKWRGIPFPVLDFKIVEGQRLAVHQYPDLDGARVESTGLKPRTFSCRAVLTNNISPGTKETWVAGTLFDQTFNQLRTALKMGTSGIIQHPKEGNLVCKAQSWTHEYIGKGPRDGVFMDVIWIETIDDTVTIQQSNSVNDALAGLSKAGNVLDNEMSKLQKFMPRQLVGTPALPSLSQFFSQISARIKLAVSVPTNFVSNVNTLGLQVNGFANSINSTAQQATILPFNIYAQEKLYGTQTARQQQDLVLSGPALQEYNNLQDMLFSTQTTNNRDANQLIENQIALVQQFINYIIALNVIDTVIVKLYLKQFLKSLQDVQTAQFSNASGYNVLQYITNAPQSLYSLTSYTNNSLGQLMTLNPNLLNNYNIPAFTVVNYYSAQ